MTSFERHKFHACLLYIYFQESMPHTPQETLKLLTDKNVSPGGRQSQRLQNKNTTSGTEQHSDKDKDNRNAHKDKSNRFRDKEVDKNVKSLRGKLVEYVHPILIAKYMGFWPVLQGGKRLSGTVYLCRFWNATHL
jgi:hypothetical protein